MPNPGRGLPKSPRSTYDDHIEGGVMVLLVDDDERFREALAELMRHHGYLVLTFADPAYVPPLRALTGVTGLLVDYQMPKEDGLAFADRFHAAYPNLPVVLITGFAGDGFEEQVAARPYLTLHRKPIDYRQLTAALRSPFDVSSDSFLHVRSWRAVL
jgi:FixJ family two-component response regulator